MRLQAVRYLAILIAVVGATSSSMVAQDLPFWLQDVEYSFDGENGTITLSGFDSSTCHPTRIWHQFADGILDVSVSEPERFICTRDLVPWSLTESFSTDGESVLQVNGSHYSLLDDGRLRLNDGPDVLLTFDVPSEPAQPVFHGLGTIDGYLTLPKDVSADGTTVVGYVTTEAIAVDGATQAFQWKPGQAVQTFGTLEVDPNSQAFKISADGSTVVGSVQADVYRNAVTWKNGAETRLGALDEPAHNVAYSVSSDGSVVVGTETFTGPTVGGNLSHDGFRWTDAGMELIPRAVARDNLGIVDVSADGTMAVGTSYANFFEFDRGDEAVVWTEKEGTQTLGHLNVDTDGSRSSSAIAISADGTTIVGTTLIAPVNGQEDHRKSYAFAWTEEDGFEDLGFLNGRLFLGTDVIDVSGDGSVIVGHNRYGIPSPNDAEIVGVRTIPFYWDEDGGMRTLYDFATNELGLLDSGDLSGWDLNQVTAISDDGTTIVGFGMSPNQKLEPWRLVLSHDGLPGDANLDGRFDSSDLVLVFEGGEYQDGIKRNSSWITGDWNRDGEFDSSDLVAAFQLGHYQTGAAAAIVPEPASLCLLAIGMIVLLLNARRSLLQV